MEDFQGFILISRVFGDISIRKTYQFWVLGPVICETQNSLFHMGKVLKIHARLASFFSLSG